MRECAVGRAAIPTEDLLRTIGDRDARVAAAIRVAVAQRGYDAVRRALLLMNARDRQRLTRILQPEDIARLATDVDERIRYAVTRCTDDPDLLRQLAADPHGRVRRAASDRVFMSLAS